MDAIDSAATRGYVTRCVNVFAIRRKNGTYKSIDPDVFMDAVREHIKEICYCCEYSDSDTVCRKSDLDNCTAHKIKELLEE